MVSSKYERKRFMYCTHCGKDIGNLGVCYNCGAVYDTDSTESASKNTANEKNAGDEFAKQAGGESRSTGNSSSSSYRSSSSNTSGSSYYSAPGSSSYNSNIPPAYTTYTGNKGKRNHYALIGFVLAFMYPLFGLILSIIGLKKEKEFGNGRKLAIAGIVISSFYPAILLLALLLGLL